MVNINHNGRPVLEFLQVLGKWAQKRRERREQCEQGSTEQCYSARQTQYALGQTKKTGTSELPKVRVGALPTAEEIRTLAVKLNEITQPRQDDAGREVEMAGTVKAAEMLQLIKLAKTPAARTILALALKHAINTPPVYILDKPPDDTTGKSQDKPRTIAMAFIHKTLVHDGEKAIAPAAQNQKNLGTALAMATVVKVNMGREGSPGLQSDRENLKVALRGVGQTYQVAIMPLSAKGPDNARKD